MKNSNKKNLIWLLIPLSGLLLLFNIFRPLREIRSASVDILFPLLSALNYPFDQARQLGDRGRIIKDMHSEIKRLNDEKRELELQYRDASLILEKYNEIRRALDLEEYKPGRLITGRVILHSPEKYFEEFIINRGKNYGVSLNDPVIKLAEDKRILIGRVCEVFNYSSKVMLLTSHEFRAGGIAPDGSRGVIRGGGNWNIYFDYIAPDSGIGAGDEIYTCGTGGVFPPGLAVGLIEDIWDLDFSMGKNAYLLPFHYPQNASYLYIMLRNKIGDLKENIKEK